SIEIIKVDDSKNPLAGVKFEILDKNKNVVATLVTDENGKTNSAKLDYGTYFYKEVSAPSGIIIDTKEYEFKIETDGQVVIKNIVNEVVKGNLKIVKVDDADKALAGVTFEILNSDKKVVDTIVTNKDGIANSKVLAYGKYTYRETKVPNGIVLDSKEYPFEIKDNNKTIVKKIVNKRIKGNFEIIKTDDNKAPLSGVKFEILDSNKKVIKTVITDKNGKASVSGLTVGKYYYREVSAPEHIVLDTKVYPFEMTGKTVTVEIENKIIKGSLKIIKIDDVKKLPIAGVTFEILDSNKKLVDTIVTDKDGIATSKQLAYGKYTYKETKVPDGIVLDSAEFPFQVTENEKVIVKKIVNVKIKGNLGILKLDAETKEPIAGVKFEILDQNKNVIETIITGKDGKAVSSILYKGTYFYREVSAPDKYIVDNTVHKFNIESNGDLIEKTVYNKAKELPVTGGLGTNNLIFLLVSTLSVVGYVAFKKKEN
ncbi:MAG: SpaA isopeptide-forming pilin-related protein, partial [Clostridia bacterium]